MSNVRPSKSLPRIPRWLDATATITLLVALAACESDKGDRGDPGAAAPDPNAPHPGLVAAITHLFGASGADGSFQTGNRITVRFTIHDDDGDPLTIGDLSRGNALVSGPTFNYQRVIPSQSDVRTRAVQVAPGTYDYQLPVPIPTVYEAPINNTASFPIGVMTGQPLLAGTYTVGLELALTTETGGETVKTPQSPTKDFRFGGAPTLEPRAVSQDANCNTCHTEVRFHGDNRVGLDNCLLCHHAGMESSSSPQPQTLDFKVLIHKLHTGKHLPSVLGVTTNPDGSRKYDAPKVPYQLGSDYSNVGFPVWPSTSQPMPRDVGWLNVLTPTEQGLEDTMRSGPIDCDKCHGDPDGAGSLEPPANGDLIYAQPTRLACGSCHDDWVWDLPYTANQQTMPPQLDDKTCILCHKASGFPLDIVDAHRHPLVDPDLALGLNFDLLSVTEAGVNDGDGTIDPGEKLQLTFTITDDAGADVDPASTFRFEVVMSGPTNNPNVVLFASMPTAALAAGGTHVVNAPEQVFLEFAGDSTPAGGEMFGTARTPHWNVAGAQTVVWSRTGVGAASTLAAAAPARQNYIDVAMGDGAMFARDDYIVIEDGVGGQEEYLKVQYVDGDRLWFSSPATRSYAPHVKVAHAINAAVQVVTVVQRTQGVDYTLDAAAGVIMEVNEFGTGAVIVDYTTDFIMPATYSGTLNESPELDESHGGWVGKTIVDGTYTVGLWSVRSFSVNAIGEITSYSEASPAATLDVLVGDATTVQPNARIDSKQACYECHDDIQFHGGGRRDYDGCVLCHSLAGAEDRPKYVAANAPNNGVTIDFRTMLHKIHQGKKLANAATYAIAGFGGAPHPDNFSLHTYEGVGFPNLVGGTANCASCHGSDNTAWIQPADRDHPTEQVLPVRVWRAACNSCHDSTSATAHVDSNTSSSGAESCELCHGPGKSIDVESAHRQR